MADDTAEFLLLLLGATVVAASVFGFFFYSEKVSYIAYEGTAEDVTWRDDPERYEALSAEQQSLFDRMVEGGDERIKEPPTYLPQYVNRSNTFHEFEGTSTFEWTAPGTFGPVLLGLIGFGTMYVAARRSIRK